MKYPLKKTSLVLLVILFSLASVFPVAADEQSTNATARGQLDKVYVNGTSYFEVTDLHMIENSNNHLVAFTAKLYNGSTRDLNIIDYWARIVGQNQNQYSVKMADYNKGNEITVPGSSNSYTFYANVGSSLSLSDLSIQFIEWDFSLSNYERILGNISIPADYDFVIPTERSKQLDMNGTEVEAKVGGMNISERQSLNEIDISLLLTNQGNSGISLPEYEYFIRTKEGLMYPLEAEEVKYKLQPRVENELELSTSVPSSVDTGNWQLVISVNEGAGNLKLPVAFFDLKATEREVDKPIPAYESHVISSDAYEISTEINRVLYTGNDLTIYYDIVNLGNQSVTLPELKYAIRTANGADYPLTAAQSAITLNPNQTREQRLSISLPVNVSKTNLQMVLIDAEHDIEFVYVLPAQSSQGKGDEVRHANADGVYTVKLDNMQRLPFDEQDIISANITISNSSSSALPLLDLTGSFSLDGVQFDENVVAKIDAGNMLNLQPYSETTVTYYVMIPYTYKFDEVQLILQEKLDDESLRSVTQFTKKADNFTIEKLSDNNSFNVDQIGKRAAARILNVNQFTGQNTDIYYLQAEMSNEERRYTQLKQLAGYFKTDDEIYFPVELTAIEHKIMPNGKVLLGLWSELPKGYDVSTLEFVLGEHIDDEQPQALVKAKQLPLPAEKDVTEALTSIPFHPYTLSLSEIDAKKESQGAINSYDMHYRFEYELTKAYYEAYTEKQDVVIELVMEDTVIDSRTFAFEEDLLLDGGEITYDVDLSHLEKEKKQEIDRTHEYTLNIYSQFGDQHRKLIVSKPLQWKWVVK